MRRRRSSTGGGRRKSFSTDVDRIWRVRLKEGEMTHLKELKPACIAGNATHLCFR
jgi:hypothetical protein